ncbi:MAG: hypothetical protein WD894_12965 [Pirellulales bacterium]
MGGTNKQRQLRRLTLALLRPLVRFGYRRRAALAALLVLAACGYGGWRLWNRVEDDVLLRPEYTLEPHQVQITPTPAWIRTDVKAEALRNGSLDGRLSILDERLAERLAQAFALHPWVAHVERVTKHYPSRVTVELTYRRPAAMVEVPGGLFPVDEEAVVLPSTDFTTVDARKYPRLVGIESQPLGPVGTPWGDRCVLDAARIAVALRAVWDDLHLQSVRRVPTTGRQFAPPETEYELITQNGTAIPWGRAPGSENSTEAPLADKLARLKKYATDNGGLDESARRNDLDLRVRDGTRTALESKLPLEFKL